MSVPSNSDSEHIWCHSLILCVQYICLLHWITAYICSLVVELKSYTSGGGKYVLYLKITATTVSIPFTCCFVWTWNLVSHTRWRT